MLCTFTNLFRKGFYAFTLQNVWLLVQGYFGFFKYKAYTYILYCVYFVLHLLIDMYSQFKFVHVHSCLVKFLGLHWSEYVY